MPFGKASFKRFAFGLCLALPSLAGCAALHPMTGVPARYLPDEMKVGHRNGKRTIDLSLLRQEWDGIHLVDSGDVLGIYIGGVLGKIDENPQVQIPQNSDYLPAAGVPVTVREDGTISLPLIGALLVRGKTMRETEEAIRQAFTNQSAGKEFLKPDRERILVSLQRPRQTRVMVVRQDSRNEPIANAAAGLLNIGTAKRGTGKVVSLPAYRNDILNALIATDGLPGLDAENAVYIIRRLPNAGGQDLPFSNATDPAELIRQNKESNRPIIRGQNFDSGNYRPQAPQLGQYQSSDPNLDYRQTPLASPSSQTMQNDQNLQGWNRVLASPAYGMGQAAIDAQQDPEGGSLNRPASAEKSVPMGVDRTGYPNTNRTDYPTVDRMEYQNTQPWGPAIGPPSPWNDGNGSQPISYSPTPLANPPQQPLTPTPMPAMQPQLGYPNNTPGQSNWPPQQPVGALPNNNGVAAPYTVPGMPPYNGGVPGPSSVAPVPEQGYSLPDYVPPGISPVGPNGAQLDLRAFDQQTGGAMTDGLLGEGRRIIRIPIRLGPDEHVDINKDDILLHDGDIVFIESRDTEVFFTGGLLGGGQFTLPRDFDLNILEALSIATSRATAGSVARQVGGVTALNGDVTISPSNVIIIRKLPEGGEIPIKIDLYKARNDLSERIVIQPGDYIFLQYTTCEAVAAFVDRHLLEGALFGLFAQQLNRPTN